MADTERKPEKSGEGVGGKQTRAEGATQEAEQGLPEHLKTKQQLLEYLKKGGKSGISTDFGKPSLFDSKAGESLDAKEHTNPRERAAGEHHSFDASKAKLEVAIDKNPNMSPAEKARFKQDMD